MLLLEHDELRNDVALFLESSPEKMEVLVCGDVPSAMRRIDCSVRLDLALVDLECSGGGGVEVIKHLRRSRPECVPVAFTSRDDAATLFDALRAGARGYLLKTTAPDQLYAALLEAAAGGAPLSPGIAHLVISAFSAEAAGETPLTKREREVLALLAKGHTYADVAKALDLGLGTVQGHVKAIYGKLEIGSKAEAAAIAMRLGLV